MMLVREKIFRLPRTKGVFASKDYSIFEVKEYAEWAISALQDGFDSRTIRILAGEAPDQNVHLINEYIERILLEFGFVYPEINNSANLACWEILEDSQRNGNFSWLQLQAVADIVRDGFCLKEFSNFVELDFSMRKIDEHGSLYHLTYLQNIEEGLRLFESKANEILNHLKIEFEICDNGANRPIVQYE